MFPSFKREYVAADLVLHSWADIKKYYDELLARPIDSLEDLTRWLNDFGETESIMAEESTRRDVAVTRNTADEALKKSHLDFLETIDPPHKEAQFELHRKYVDLPLRKKLGPEFKELDATLEVEVTLFNKENVDIETQVDTLCQEYQVITGAWTVILDGMEQTFPQAATYLEKADRETRRQAWMALATRRLLDTNKLETLFDGMLAKRQLIAKNLTLPSYREYIFKQNHREYTPDDCFEFHDSVGNCIVPLVGKIRNNRRITLGGGTLKPWDLHCDPSGKPELKPFESVEKLKDGVETIFGRIDPRLSTYFHAIRDRQDLDSRKNKAPGGYQATFAEERLPFIFSNSAGSQEDIETLLHEAGHSFHTLEHRNQPLYWYRGAPMEFCEVASMTQELMGGEHLDVFYKDPTDAARARKKHLESILELFPWVMTVDAYQHWVYTHGGHTREERTTAWRNTYERFDCGVDWTGLDPAIKNHLWHRQLHIFLDPFYYIEYAISQLGALQIYRNYRDNPKKALTQFLSAMSKGASVSCSELYKEAGIEFRFDAALVKELADMVYKEIESLHV